MNFAMMFALAIGIDYALFLVVRYRAARAARANSDRNDIVGKQWAIAQTMDTAGKAVLLSGLTLLSSAVMLVPSPSFRSMASGIMLSVVFVLAATLTLLPLVLFKLDNGSLAHSGRVIFAAGAVMVAVFSTFALSGPIPPKEMDVVLGIAVLLDDFLVRLVLLPVLLRLTGKAAWYTPAWLKRILPSITFVHD